MLLIAYLRSDYKLLTGFLSATLKSPFSRRVEYKDSSGKTFTMMHTHESACFDILKMKRGIVCRRHQYLHASKDIPRHWRLLLQINTWGFRFIKYQLNLSTEAAQRIIRSMRKGKREKEGQNERVLEIHVCNIYSIAYNSFRLAIQG